VDVVSEFNAYKFDKQFDVVISADALEHDRLWKQSILKMYELVKPNGLLICTA
jgi:2-polyprenyl-3-methyl-5-hydroxy-6-metoxy-1,4-benzoquinol methylase